MSGCLSQMPSSLWPCAVLHRLRRPSRLLFLPPRSFGFGSRLSADRADASSFMCCDRSCVRRLKMAWFVGSVRRDRLAMMAERAERAMGRESSAMRERR